MLRRAGHRVDVVAGDSPAASTDLARRAAGRGAALVLLGGDGLVHQVLPAVLGTGTPVGLVPGGTGNDTVTALGLPADPGAAADAVVDALAAGATTAVDVGLARSDDGVQTPFTTVLCWGFDAAVSERTARLRWPRGAHRYDLAIALETLALQHRTVRVSVDDVALPATDALLVAVGNGGWYGGGKRMVPHARPDDGRLAVTLVGPATRRVLARLAPRLPAAGHLGHPLVTTHDGVTVHLDADAPIAAWADGERVGRLPLTVTTRPDALTVLRPAWCVPAEPLGPFGSD